jgi:hypothetical protein
MSCLEVVGQTYQVSIQNQVVVGTAFQFDVYVLQTGATTWRMADVSLVLTFNSSAFSDRGMTYVSASTNLAAGYAISPSITTSLDIDIEVQSPTTYANSTQISSADNGTRIGTFQVSTISNPAEWMTLAWKEPKVIYQVMLERLTNEDINDISNVNSYASIPNAQLPVELEWFVVATAQKKVVLTWRTLTEKNNYGFQVQRRREGDQAYADVPNGFVAGHGTTNVPQSYSFTDQNSAGGPWSYRLKQVDLDGAVTYYTPTGSNGTTTEAKVIEKPKEFNLAQNYPNPFNPTTRIQYALPKETHVRLEVFNVIGQKVTTLVDAAQPAGYYDRAFDATGLPSGLYFYRLVTPEVNFLKKMMVVK